MPRHRRPASRTRARFEAVGLSAPDNPGGVNPTTGTRPVNTLPPTDTIDQSATSGPGGAGLVLLFLGLGSFVSLVATRARRRPAAIEVKEDIDRR